MKLQLCTSLAVLGLLCEVSAMTTIDGGQIHPRGDANKCATVKVKKTDKFSLRMMDCSATRVKAKKQASNPYRNDWHKNGDMICLTYKPANDDLCLQYSTTKKSVGIGAGDGTDTFKFNEDQDELAPWTQPGNVIRIGKHNKIVNVPSPKAISIASNGEIVSSDGRCLWAKSKNSKDRIHWADCSAEAKADRTSKTWVESGGKITTLTDKCLKWSDKTVTLGNVNGNDNVWTTSDGFFHPSGNSAAILTEVGFKLITLTPRASIGEAVDVPATASPKEKQAFIDGLRKSSWMTITSDSIGYRLTSDPTEGRYRGVIFVNLVPVSTISFVMGDFHTASIGAIIPETHGAYYFYAGQLDNSIGLYAVDGVLADIRIYDAGNQSTINDLGVTITKDSIVTLNFDTAINELEFVVDGASIHLQAISDNLSAYVPCITFFGDNKGGEAWATNIA